MAYSLVGTIGAIATGTSGATLTPSWGSGESRTANNLLLLAVGDQGSLSTPATPSGWTAGPHVTATFIGSFCSISLFYKIAAGSDAAPSITGVGGALWVAQLAEFSGNVTSSPLDQSNNASGTGAFSNPAADATAGELIFATVMNNSGNTATATMNNGASATRSSGSGLYTWWGVTTGNSSADTLTPSGLSLPSAEAIASFKVASTPVVTLSTSTLLSLGVG